MCQNPALTVLYVPQSALTVLYVLFAGDAGRGGRLRGRDVAPGARDTSEPVCFRARETPCTTEL